jgi:hypothetical protein
MIRYTTPDEREWLYGGNAPVGITSDLAHVLHHDVKNVGELTWEQHSQLWAGAIDGARLKEVAEAIVMRVLENGQELNADALAGAVRALLTHPGAES